MYGLIRQSAVNLCVPAVRVSSRVKMADRQAAGMASQTSFDVWGLPAPADLWSGSTSSGRARSPDTLPYGPRDHKKLPQLASESASGEDSASQSD